METSNQRPGATPDSEHAFNQAKTGLVLHLGAVAVSLLIIVYLLKVRLTSASWLTEYGTLRLYPNDEFIYVFWAVLAAFFFHHLYYFLNRIRFYRLHRALWVLLPLIAGGLLAGAILREVAYALPYVSYKDKLMWTPFEQQQLFEDALSTRSGADLWCSVNRAQAQICEECRFSRSRAVCRDLVKAYAYDRAHANILERKRWARYGTDLLMGGVLLLLMVLGHRFITSPARLESEWAWQRKIHNYGIEPLF